MNVSRTRASGAKTRLIAACGTATLVSAALLVPSSAAFAHDGHDHDEQTGAACQVDQATLGWGMKASFRTYITGGIANGSWELGEGVEYIDPALEDTGAVTPGTDLFSWGSGTGEFSSDLMTGMISFTGGIYFSGHDGALELDIANPVIELDGVDTAYLLLEVSETVTDEATPQVRAAKIDTAGVLETNEGALSLQGAPAYLTAEGAAAFNGDEGRGTYVSGEEMDPIFFTTETSGCELGTVEAAEEAPEEEAVAVQEETADPGIPWLPIIIGGVALIVIGVAVGMLVAGRPKKTSAPAESTGSADAAGTPAE